MNNVTERYYDCYNESMIVEYLLKGSKTLSLNLSFQGHGLGLKFMKCLANVLCNENIILTQINLRCSAMDVEKYKILSAALEKNKSVVELDLNSTLEYNNHVINTKKTEAMQHVFKALQTNTSIRVLNLNCNRLGPEAMQYLATALAVNTTLTNLCLSNNQIRTQGLEYLVTGLEKNKTLTELDLSSNIIGDGIISFSTMLK